MEESSNKDDTNDVDDNMKHHQSLPDLKPHFIIKEYYGTPKRESQNVYLEEKIQKNNKDTVKNKKQKIHKDTHTSIFDKVVLIGGAIAGGAIGLYIFGQANEQNI